jgi:hypothetical protein
VLPPCTHQLLDKTRSSALRSLFCFHCSMKPLVHQNRILIMK